MQNPYESPDPNQQLHPLEATVVDAHWQPPATRPGGLTAVCIIAIILGSLGLLGSLAGLVRHVCQSVVTETFATQRPQNVPKELREMVEAQEQMQKKTQAVENRYWKITLGMTGLNLLFAASLLTGGIMALKLIPKARTLLVAVFAAAIAFEIVCAVITVFMQMDLAEAMSGPMTRMMQSTAPKGGGTEQVAAMGSIMAKIIAFVGIATTVGYALAKIIFYGVGVGYLGRPKIRELFQRPRGDVI
jgi:hypothetical protein